MQHSESGRLSRVDLPSQIDRSDVLLIGIREAGPEVHPIAVHEELIGVGGRNERSRPPQGSRWRGHDSPAVGHDIGRAGDRRTQAKLQASGSTPMGSAVPFTVRSSATRPGAEDDALATRCGVAAAAAFSNPGSTPATATAADVRTPLAKKVRRSNGFTRSHAPAGYCGR